MGTLVGHVAPGLGFFLIGLWHLFNHTKLHLQNPNSYTSPPWFPTSKHKYLELFLIMLATTASISMELFIGPNRHQPFDTDGTIPSYHLHNFEHASISLTFFIYALFSIILDQLIKNKTSIALTQLLGAVAFAQQLLLFHLHSSDHMGPEGQYHLLLQIVILISLATTLLGISMVESFLVSFVRSVSIMFQGIWLMVMGFMLWTPGLIAKGCFMNDEEGHKVVRCENDESLHRAVSLVNILFSWFVIAVAVFGVSFYLVLNKLYGGGKVVDVDQVRYFSLGEEEEREEDDDDVESQSQNKEKMPAGNPKSFTHVGNGKSFFPLDIER